MTRSIPYTKPWLDTEEIEEVVQVLRSGWLTQGPYVERFERELSSYFNVAYAVTFSSGTAALHAAYFAAGIQDGDQVLVPALTFVATANAVLYCGATPIFVDIEPDTGNVDVEQIEVALNTNPRVKAIVVVHYAGHPVNLEPISHLARQKGVFLIEDACHAPGALYRERKIGDCTYSDMAVFSFHPTKHITTGEGGAVTTNDPSLYRRLLLFRNHGIRKDGLQTPPPGPWYYEMIQMGYNYRLSDLNAALGCAQLKKLDAFVRLRREKAAYYHARFQDNPYFELPVEKPYAYHAYHLYPIRLNPSLAPYRSRIMELLKAQGIGTQVHFIPVYWHPYYQTRGYPKGLCPRAEAFFQAELSLPLFPSLTQQEQDYVADTLLSLLSHDPL